MQKKEDIQGFDLMVSEMLQDASVKAPGGVWRAVRRRISEDSFVSRHPELVSGSRLFGWRMAAAALSFAAVLCAGVFFAWNSGDVKTEAICSLEKVQTPVTATPASTLAPAFAPSTIASSTLAPSTLASGSIAAIGPVHTNSGENITDNGTISEKPAERAVEETRAGDVSPHSDPFAEMERQDRLAAANSRRPSMTVSGNLSSNSEFSAAGSFLGAGGDGSGTLVKTGLESFGLPLQIGVGIKIPLTKKFSLGTGLSYTFLSSVYDAEYRGSSGDVRHNMSYAGIPLNLFYELVNLGKVSIYAHTGGTAEYCISNKYHFRGNETAVIKEPVRGFMFSVGAGLGMEFNVARNVGIYFDPSFRYYFHCNHPSSIRTEKPQTFNFEAGIRFSL